jgi:hypothetical protein
MEKILVDMRPGPDNPTKDNEVEAALNEGDEAIAPEIRTR